MNRYDLSTHAAEQSLLVSAALGDFIRYADHAAFVERVREIAEGMEHAHDCDIRKPGHMVGGISFDVNSPPRAHEVKRKCNCPRGKLLEVLNG